MNWRRLAWLLTILIIFTIIWAAIELKDKHEKIAYEKPKDAELTDQELASLKKRIQDQRELLNRLEKSNLWSKDQDLVSWLNQQANASDTRIIGVEHPPSEKLSEYRRVYVKITVRGDYNPLGRFVNRLEYSPNAIHIDSFRIKRRDYSPEYVAMDIWLSYLQKEKNT